MDKTLHFLLLLASYILQASGARILGVFPHVAKSHFVMAEQLMIGLAAEGHEVVVVSHFPQKKPIPNYRDISLVGSMPEFVSAVPLDDIATGRVYTIISLLAHLGVTGCEQTFSFPEVQKLINSNEKFDLVINEPFNTDCYAVFAHKFNVPLISIATTPLLPWCYARFGAPDNPSYVGNIFLGYSDKMAFRERLENAFLYVLIHWVYHFWFHLPSQEIVWKYFGESTPPLSELVKNTSLIFVNRHFSINQPIPNVPAVIEVGGLHVPIPKKLPQDLEKFMNESQHGVIVFSLGSTVRADTFSKQKRNAFVQAFQELPYDVLWKWEGEILPGEPKNIKTSKWMPQGDVLAHPNVKAFLTHGGLMGTMEAVYAGVPLVIVPLFGDQFHNAKNYEDEGVGVQIDYATITKETVLTALTTVLNNPRYTERAREISRAFKDRPMTPLQTAIFWTEYVLRHRGAPHLRSAGADLSWYQYLLIDVIAVLIFIVVCFLVITYYILKFFISVFSSTSRKQKVKSN